MSADNARIAGQVSTSGPSDSELGRRIAVFGGGGKTTLADAISRKLGVRHIELDEIHHQANWTPRSMDEIRAILVDRMDGSPDGWVVDGNYSAVRPEVLKRADTVVVIQLPFCVMFWRIFKRTVIRSWSREELWNGNRESWRLTFASRDSILLEIIGKRRAYSNACELIRGETPPGTTFYPLTSSGDLERFYVRHGLKRRRVGPASRR